MVDIAKSLPTSLTGMVFLYWICVCVGNGTGGRIRICNWYRYLDWIGKARVVHCVGGWCSLKIYSTNSGFTQCVIAL